MPPRIDIDRRRVSLDPRDPEFFRDPYPAYRAIRAKAPVFFWEQYGHWCFASHADVSALLRDRRFGRRNPCVGGLGSPEPPQHLAPFHALERHSLLELEPPEHTRLRALVNRAFVSRQVERLGPRVAALAHDLVDAFDGVGEAELISAFAMPIPVVVIAELIGVPAEMAPRLLDWSHRMVAMYQFGVTLAVEAAAASAAAEFAGFLRECVAERRRASRDDLISRLVEADTDGGRLTEDELVSVSALLLNAGHEATVHAIGNALKAILDHGLVDIVRDADARESGAIVEELLRFDAPLHLFTRYALQDLDYAGAPLARGDRIGLLLGAANRDPLAFPEPDRVDFTRAKNPHVAFGAGIHFCVGAPLARLEMRVALPILLRRLPRLRWAEPPCYRDAFHFHGLEALRVAWG